MVVIEELIIKKRYYYLWLKSVTGYDLSVHCAKCLIGEYSKAVNRNVTELYDVSLPASPYYYLCGVRNYHDNIHIAFEEAEGEEIYIETDCFVVVIKNARQIKFDESIIDQSLPQAKKKEYYSCRNWQFANWLKHWTDL